MKVLVIEDNLIWSTKLSNSLRALGHEPRVSTGSEGDADLAIVNLSNPRLKPFEALADLRSKGIPVVGHAGHKEKELLCRAKDAGVRVASNSELTFKLRELLEEMRVG